MRRRDWIRALLALFFLAPGWCPLVAAPLSTVLAERLEAAPEATQRVIVLLEDAPGARSYLRSLGPERGPRIEALQQNARLAQAPLLAELPRHGGADVVSNWLVNGVVLDASPDLVRWLQDRPEVRRIEASEKVQLEPVIQEVPAGQLAEGDTEERTWGLDRIRALEARATFGVDGSGVIVGILDTGFDAEHPLLAGKLLAFRSFVDENTNPVDGHGHGSHCAGTIGGSAGDGPEIGVAPGVQFVAGQIFHADGGATTEGILAAMQWVVDPDGVPGSGDEPRLVSNSWGGGPGRKVYLEAVQSWIELGVAPIFAAGNSGPRAGTVGTPGGYLESFAVGATAVDHSVARFSSRGPVTWDGEQFVKPDISAPGKNVTSVKSGGGYWTISGTSMACPHVAGLAALLYQARPDLSVEELFQAIHTTSVDQGEPGKDNSWGFGEIDAVAALTRVVEGGRVRGRVLSSLGTRVEFAHVTLDETGVEARIDAEGRFEMVLAAGTYHLSGRAFGHAPVSAQVFEVAAGQQVEVDLVLEPAPRGLLEGRILGRGVPVPGKVQILETPLAPVSSDASGAFRMELPEGSYRALFTALGFEAGTSAHFEVRAGTPAQVEIDLEALPPVLVVDDDAGKSYERYYTQALSLPHKVLAHDDVAEVMSPSFLSQYEVVVWFTGDQRRGILSEQDVAAVGGFLDQGGRLLLTGQDLASSLRMDRFLNRFLGVKIVSRSSRQFEVSGQGLELGIRGGDGARNQRYPDHVEAAPGRRSEVILRYPDGKGAAVRRSVGNSRSILLGFGLEGVSSTGGRKALMAACLRDLRPSAGELAERLRSLSAEDPEAPRLAEVLRELVRTRLDQSRPDLGDRELDSRSRFQELHRR